MPLPLSKSFVRAVVGCAAAALQFALLANSHAGSLELPNDALTFPAENFSFPIENLSLPESLEQLETPVSIEVVLAADVLFDFDKAEIRTSAAPSLRDLAQIIRDKARGPVTIQGYTNAIGNDAYNQRLSERRAASVKVWLISREHLKAAFSTAGFGARNPVAPNRHPDGTDDPEGRQQNRRVTVTMRK